MTRKLTAEERAAMKEALKDAEGEEAVRAALEGKAVLYFRDAKKFKERYAMLGFNDRANLDDGSMWPIAYALPKLTKADEARIAKLVKQAVS